MKYDDNDLFAISVLNIVDEFIKLHPQYKMHCTATSVSVSKNNTFEIDFSYNGYSVDIVLRSLLKDDFISNKFEIIRPVTYDMYIETLQTAVKNILENFDNITTEWFKQFKTFEHNINSIMAINSVNAGLNEYTKFF